MQNIECLLQILPALLKHQIIFLNMCSENTYSVVNKQPTDQVNEVLVGHYFNNFPQRNSTSVIKEHITEEILFFFFNLQVSYKHIWWKIPMYTRFSKRKHSTWHLWFHELFISCSRMNEPNKDPDSGTFYLNETVNWISL